MQETNLYTATVVPMMRTLENLSGILDKLSSHAAGKQLQWHPEGLQESALLQSRLISDQFPFMQQVQVACDNAKGGAARLAGIESPKFEDNEKTVAELKVRVEKTVAFMKTIKPEQIIGKEDMEITMTYWQGKKLKAFDYVEYYLIPNFYFHVVTAYAILRSNGVQIGKSDFTGPMPFMD